LLLLLLLTPLLLLLPLLALPLTLLFALLTLLLIKLRFELRLLSWLAGSPTAAGSISCRH
jgi:hypothetical protein